MTLHQIINILRQPAGRSVEEMRIARKEAATILEAMDPLLHLLHNHHIVPGRDESAPYDRRKSSRGEPEVPNQTSDKSNGDTNGLTV